MSIDYLIIESATFLLVTFLVIIIMRPMESIYGQDSWYIRLNLVITS